MSTTNKALKALITQISFFTVIPVPQRLVDIRLGLRYLDFSVLTVSTVLLLVLLPLEVILKWLHVPSALERTLLYVVTLFVTGFLHLDGFTDVVDAIFSPADKRLEVLKDPRVGACGAAALTLLILMGTISLLCCSASPSLVLYLSDLAGRTACSISVRLGKPLHKGLGSIVVEELSSSKYLYRLGPLASLIFTLLVSYILGTSTLVAVVLGLTFSVLVVYRVVRILGGISGDVLGFAIELSRHLTLLIFSCAFGR